MSSSPTPRKRRTFSAFGDVRKMPSEYEVMTHDMNWTLRPNRKAAFEQNPSSPANLWFLTYRDRSPLQVETWNKFRDPDAVTYRTYVTAQSDAETTLRGILDEYSEAGATEGYSESWVRTLGTLFTPTRYLVHGMQQVQAYIGHIAPSSYITNVAAFSTADLLRRVTFLAYRTREIELAHPQSGVGNLERRTWENEAGWQGVREVIETALIAYDWAEAFTALNLVIAPTLDSVLITQFREVARDNDDEVSWLALGALLADSKRRDRWTAELSAFAVRERPENAAVLQKWVDRWSERVDAAVAPLAGLFASLPDRGRPAADVQARAREDRAALHGKAGLAAASAGV